MPRRRRATGCTALRARLEAHRGECAVRVHLVIPDQSETVVALSSRRGVDPSESLLREVDGLFGRPVADRQL